jgi:hypothetical protein
MTLRDYFAAAALPACIHVAKTPDQVADRAFRIAEAMMEAREK